MIDDMTIRDSIAYVRTKIAEMREEGGNSRRHLRQMREMELELDEMARRDEQLVVQEALLEEPDDVVYQYQPLPTTPPGRRPFPPVPVNAKRRRERLISHTLPVFQLDHGFASVRPPTTHHPKQQQDEQSVD